MSLDGTSLKRDKSKHNLNEIFPTHMLELTVTEIYLRTVIKMNLHAFSFFPCNSETQVKNAKIKISNTE